MSRKMRSLAAAGVFSLAVATSLLVGVGTPAGANCFGGLSNPLTLYNIYDYEVAKEDSQSSGTCNSDSVYAGKVQDPITDGSCAMVYFGDYGYYGQQGYSCTTSWSNYLFYDTNSDSNSDQDLATDYTYQTFVCSGY